jgi:peroxiredoxin Q/BCP
VIAPGEPAPDFEAPDEDRRPVRLRDLRGAPVVLAFYPKASSPGCSSEMRAFARSFPRFRELGARVVGISADAPEAQRRFALRCALPFPLVADAGGAIARRYGVRGLFGVPRRTTFVVAPDGRVVAVTRSPLPGPHAARAMRALERLAATAPV